MWNWEQTDWPKFRYDANKLAKLEAQFIKNSGEWLGAFKHISDNEKELLKIELISEEALQTSKIEGEILDRDSLQSSIGRQFGLNTDGRQIPLAEQGIAMMMVDLYKGFDQPLNEKRLHSWHKMLMNGRIDLKNIGSYRTHEDAMQVVSGISYDRKVHFEAPPSNQMTDQMAEFLNWFKNSAPKSKNPISPLIRAGIAHLYFVCIHPFEDGNGRIGRAISEKSLAENLGQPTLIALAYTIERNRKDYYSALERNNKDNEITSWLIYFAEMIIEAQRNTLKRIEFIIEKTKLYDAIRGKLNERQSKAIDRMFREGADGFKGGLSAKNYITITGASRATATRDLNDMIEKLALIRIGELKHARYYLNISQSSE